MVYGIILLPTKEIQQIANSYRRRYDPHYSIIPPHITIRNKFEATPKEISEIKSSLSQVVETLKPFTVQIDKVSTFFPSNNTLYLAINQTEELNCLYDKVNSIFNYSDSLYRFTPHITLAQNISPDELHDIYSNLRMKELHLISEIDSAHIMIKRKNRWEIFQSFKFSNLEYPQKLDSKIKTFK